RLQVDTQLLTPFRIQEHVQTGTGADAHVVVALGADFQVLFQFGLVQHRVAGGTLVPQTFRYGTLGNLGTHDRGDQLVYQPVAHIVLRSFDTRAAPCARGEFQ